MLRFEEFDQLHVKDELLYIPPATSDTLFFRMWLFAIGDNIAEASTPAL